MEDDTGASAAAVLRRASVVVEFAAIIARQLNNAEIAGLDCWLATRGQAEIGQVLAALAGLDEGVRNALSLRLLQQRGPRLI